MKSLIERYMEKDCTLETSIKDAYIKGFQRGFAKARGWIKVSAKLPEPETMVLVTYRTEEGLGVTTAIYEDGTVYLEESKYVWDTPGENMEYDDIAGDYILPEGWWEDGTYNESIEAVTDEVVAWMPLPKPYEERE